MERVIRLISMEKFLAGTEVIRAFGDDEESIRPL